MFQGKVKDRSIIFLVPDLPFSPTMYLFSLLLWFSYSTLFSGIHPIFISKELVLSVCAFKFLPWKCFHLLSLNNFDDRLIKFTSVISFTYCGFPSLLFFVDITFSSVILNPSFCFPFHIPWFLPFIFHAFHLYADSMDFAWLKILFSSSDLFWFLPVLIILFCFLYSPICESSHVRFDIWL